MYEDLNDELLLALPNVLDHLPDIAHVVDVLKLRWSRQQLLRNLLKHLQSCQDDRLRVGALRCQQRVEDFEGCRRARGREHQR